MNDYLARIIAAADPSKLPKSINWLIGVTFRDQLLASRANRRFTRLPHADDSLDALAWGRKYLPAHFRKRPSLMHEWLNNELAHFRTDRGRKVSLIGPRGGAKSTIGTLCYVLQAAVHGWESYIWIVSDTKQQAQTHLENVKLELTDNKALAECYRQAVGRGPRWQATAIELNNGVVIESYGTGQAIRGRRRREHRPTLIVCDDLQNDSHISSAAQREASRRWFHGTLLKAGTKRTNILNLATALHRDALSMELLDAPGWNSKRFAAINTWPTNLELWQRWEDIYTQGTKPPAEPGADGRKLVATSIGDSGTQPPALPGVKNAASEAREFYEANEKAMLAGAVVLWPEEEDLYTLMQMRVESGRTAFEREKQGCPVDPELCEWPESYFEDHIWFESWEGASCQARGASSETSASRLAPSALVIKTMALDPSKGRDSHRGDYSAYVMLGIDAAGVIYVEADLARRPTPQMVADGVACFQRFQPLSFGIEANQYQELLAGEFLAEFARQGLAHILPAALHNHVNKQLRIRRLGPYLSQRRLRFHAGSASTRLLVDQLRDFPAAAHDDGPDALEMALRLAEEIWHGKNADDGLGSNLVHS